MAKKLYVGNLAYSINDDRLREIFAPYGNVESARVVMDRASGRSKGFGFVEYSSEEEAQAAINALNQTDADGRSLRVSEARPQEEGGGHRGGGGGYGGGGGFGGGGRDGGRRGGNGGGGRGPRRPQF